MSRVRPGAAPAPIAESSSVHTSQGICVTLPRGTAERHFLKRLAERHFLQNLMLAERHFLNAVNSKSERDVSPA